MRFPGCRLRLSSLCVCPCLLSAFQVRNGEHACSWGAQVFSYWMVMRCSGSITFSGFSTRFANSCLGAGKISRRARSFVSTALHF